jgi:hypothetical protein
MAKVTVNKNTYIIEPVYQWDLNQVLEIHGMSFATAPEVHFAHDGAEFAFVRSATIDAAGVIHAKVPNVLLQKAQRVNVYLCTYEGNSFQTVNKFVMPVQARNCPGDYTMVDDYQLYDFTSMDVEAITLPPGSDVTLEKLLWDSGKTVLRFGLPSTPTVEEAREGIVEATLTEAKNTAAIAVESKTAAEAAASIATQAATSASHSAQAAVTAKTAAEQARDDAQAMLQLKSNPNLLENWYFADPINQKGQTEFPVSSRRYTIDRWVATANALVSVVDGGIRISNAVSTAQSLVQYLELGVAPKEGEPVTLSCLTVSGELYSGTVKMPPYGSKYWTVFTTGGGVSGRVYSAADDNYDRVAFLIPQGTQEDIAAVKFERGSVQTLAVRGEDGNWVLNDPVPNKVLEPQKCKRYFERVKATGANLTLGVGTAGSTSKLYVTLPISPKRVKPSADALTACVGNLRYGTGTLTSTPTAVSVYSIDLDSGLCTLEITGTFTTGTAYRVGLVAGGYLDFDSNL